MKLIKSLIIIILCQFFLFNSLPIMAQESINSLNTKIEKIEKQNSNKEVPARTFKKFTPYKVTLKNLSSSEYILDFKNIKLLTEDNKEILPANRNFLYKKSKAHPIIRSILVGTVTTICCVFVAIPVTSTTFAFGVDTNNTLKKELDKLYFDTKTIQPDQEIAFYTFVPNKTQLVKEVIIK